MFHIEQHTPEEARVCRQPDLKTFVDNACVHVLKEDDVDLKQTIMKTMTTIQNYMSANKLSLNPDKSLTMILTKDDLYRKQFHIDLGSKTIRHSRHVNILGNTMSDQLMGPTCEQILDPGTPKQSKIY